MLERESGWGELREKEQKEGLRKGGKELEFGVRIGSPRFLVLF